MVEITSRITKIGNSFAFFIPKALVKCKVLPLGKEITLKVEENPDPSKPVILNLVRGSLSKPVGMV